MSEKNCNVGGIELLENVLVTSTKAIQQVSTAAAVNDSAAKAVADRPLHSDPVSPATAVPKKGVDLPTDDEPKVILNLEIAKMHSNGNDKIDDTVEAGSKSEIETVRISNADSSNEIAHKEVFLHNNRIKTQSSSDDDNFEVVEIIGMPVSDMKSSPTRKNPLEDVSNDELLAILEGDVDSTTAKIEPESDDAEPTVVFEIINVTEKTVTEKSQESVDEDDIKKIAREQMNSMKVKKRGRPPGTTKAVPKVSELVSSLVSDWSDTEKDSEPMDTGLDVKPSPTPAKQMSVVRKKQSVKKDAPAATPFKTTRIIKKKIIWDPDAPETQISYASLVRTSITPRKRQTSASKAVSVTPPPVQQQQVSLLKPKTEPNISLLKSKMEHVPLIKPKPAQQPATAQPKMRILNTGKRSSTSPPRIAQNKRKRVTEVDKLLNDEGAANMLNTLESEKIVPKEQRAKKPPTPVPTTPEKPSKKETPTKKRGPRTSAASSWDYVYNQRNVDSLIIRRRSNSSYSSTTSPRRLSSDATKSSPNQRGGKNKSKTFEFAKPENKKVGKKSPGGGASETLIADDIRKTEVRESTRKSNRTPTPVESKETATNSPKASTAANDSDGADKKGDDVTIKRHGSVVQIILKPKLEKVKNTFTVELMTEVVRQLSILEEDSACKVVIITSAAANFCNGIDFSTLVHGTAEKRKNSAQELASSVTLFLKALLSFPKPLIAGITGSCSGIGVTMLPLFDIVISSDKSTFETSYSKIGQLPEGHCILTATSNVRHSFKIKLLWLCEKLSSTEAALSGMVTKLTSPIKVIEDAIQCAKRTAMLSQQALLSLKAQRHDLKKIASILNDEQKILVSQWLTAECQDKFKQFIAKEHW